MLLQDCYDGCDLIQLYNNTILSYYSDGWPIVLQKKKVRYVWLFFRLNARIFDKDVREFSQKIIDDIVKCPFEIDWSIPFQLTVEGLSGSWTKKQMCETIANTFAGQVNKKQVEMLSKMVESLGEKEDVIELNLGSGIIDWVEINSQNRPKKFLSGYKMQVKTSIPKLENQDLSTADIQQRFWDNYNELSPFEVAKSWIKSVKNNTFFDKKRINIKRVIILIIFLILVTICIKYALNFVTQNINFKDYYPK